MTEPLFSYDPDENVIRLNGSAGATVMLGILTRAKFGEANDPETLFHEPLAELLNALRPPDAQPRDEDLPGHSAAFLQGIAAAIVSESYRSGWWNKSRDEQQRFLQQVVAAPDRFTEREIEFLFEEIDNGLFQRRRITDAAAAVNRE